MILATHINLFKQNPVIKKTMQSLLFFKKKLLGKIKFSL